MNARGRSFKFGSFSLVLWFPLHFVCVPLCSFQILSPQVGHLDCSRSVLSATVQNFVRACGLTALLMTCEVTVASGA